MEERTAWLRLPAENALVLQQNELHDLVLVHHVDRNVARLRLGPQQRGSEDDGHTLGGHPVGLAVFDHTGDGEERVTWTEWSHMDKLDVLVNQDQL